MSRDRDSAHRAVDRLAADADQAHADLALARLVLPLLAYLPSRLRAPLRPRAVPLRASRRPARSGWEWEQAARAEHTRRRVLESPTDRIPAQRRPDPSEEVRRAPRA